MTPQERDLIESPANGLIITILQCRKTIQEQTESVWVSLAATGVEGINGTDGTDGTNGTDGVAGTQGAETLVLLELTVQMDLMCSRSNWNTRS
jgi:hypothetical protein